MSMLEKARAAWGADLPDWVEVLARSCDRERSLRRAAERIGYTAGAVSSLIHRRYAAKSTRNLEAAVRENLMRTTVQCPGLGEIEGSTCRQWREKARHLVVTSGHRVAMYHACRACTHNRKEQQS